MWFCIGVALDTAVSHGSLNYATGSCSWGTKVLDDDFGFQIGGNAISKIHVLLYYMAAKLCNRKLQLGNESIG